MELRISTTCFSGEEWTFFKRLRLEGKVIMKFWKKVLTPLVGGLVALAAGSAHAESILVQYVSGGGLGSGPFTFTYSVFLTPVNMLTSTSTPNFGTYTNGDPRASDFFTLLDVEGLNQSSVAFTPSAAGTAAGATTSSFGFTFTGGTLLPGKTGNGTDLGSSNYSILDSGTYPNIVGTFQGSTAINSTIANVNLLLGTLTFQSNVGLLALKLQLGSDTVKDGGPGGIGPTGFGDDGKNNDLTYVPTSAENGGGLLPTPAACAGGFVLFGLLGSSRLRNRRDAKR